MRPTKYNKRITIQTSIQTDTDTGGLEDVWTDSFTCFASVEPVRGQKRLEYGQLGYTSAYEVEMRKRTTNVNTTNRAVYKTENYQIIGMPMIDDDRVRFDIAKRAV